jgi:3-methyladenine DNA glycosylase AlkD
MAAYRNKRLAELRKKLEAASDTKHAEFHKEYHKSTKKFYGLRSAALVAAVTEVFPKKEPLPKEEALKYITELWRSEWFEEQAAAIMLLERIAKQLTPKDLPLIKTIADGCEGWALLDFLATKPLGVLTLNYGDAIYSKVSAWSKSKHLWTRRASILIHVLPARKKQLRADIALPTFEKLLHEKEFFIRKAIGWTLREISKHYPEITFEFLKEHKAKTSALALREGGRNLPAEYRKALGIK